MPNIQAFRLSNGEEVVASVVEENDNHFVLSKPRLLMITPMGEGQMNLSMVPWMICAQDPSSGMEFDSILNKSIIAGFPQQVPSSLEKGYLRNTSAIQLVSG